MGTTIFPTPNAGPFDDDGPTFPAVTGRGMGYEHEQARLREAKTKDPKKIIKEAEGVLNPAHSKAKKVKKGPAPKNLRASERSNKHGAFGESYTAPPGNKSKGIRVSESALGSVRTMESILGSRRLLASVLQRFRASRFAKRMFEAAPEGWEGTVKHMKKHEDIDNPWALAHYMKGEGYTPHH